MARIRMALAQVDVTVGDLTGNVARILEWTARASALGARLVAFPEMAVTGYPPEDLVLRRSFVAASVAAVERLAGDLAAAGLADVTVVVGYLDDDSEPFWHRQAGVWPNPGSTAGAAPVGTGRRNAVAVLRHGRVEARYFKHHLPNYGVFDEYRYFEPGGTYVSTVVDGVEVALAICEDAWRPEGPFDWAAAAGADVVVVVNGSPYEREKDDVRLDLCRTRAAECGATVAYVNLVGGQDELVFDGDSMVVAPDGTVLARAPQFVEHLLVADVPDRAGASDIVPGPVAPPLGDHEEVWRAIVLGTGDYVRKSGFSSVLLGLSGGIDSAVAATVAADALGAANVVGVGMPTPWSSDHSVADAQALATRQGMQWRLIPVGGILDAFLAAFPCEGLALENLQARIRGQLLMTISNAEGHMVLATGNKSELATGFSTLYGDSAGGFAPLKDVPKSLVWDLARWRNAQAAARGETAPIPGSSIDKPPSAELAPGQLDTDRLPEYELLDTIMHGYVHDDLERAELVARGLPEPDVTRLIRMTDTAEYKRRQYPPGPKISGKAFGRDRRLPIVNHWRQ